MRCDVGPVVPVPAWVITHVDLKSTDIKLYCILACRIAMRGDGDTPTRSTLAADMGGVSIETVKRGLRALETVGALSIQQVQGGASYYTLNLAGSPQNPLAHEYPEALEVPVQSAPGLMVVQTGLEPLQTPTSSGHSDDPTTRVRTYSSTSTNKKERRLSEADYVRTVKLPRFDEVWERWPIQAGRYQARLRWWRMDIETDDLLWVDLHNGMTRWLEYWEKTGTKRSHIPYLNTWLERRGWEDRPVADDGDDDERRAVAYLKEVVIDD